MNLFDFVLSRTNDLRSVNDSWKYNNVRKRSTEVIFTQQSETIGLPIKKMGENHAIKNEQY